MFFLYVRPVLLKAWTRDISKIIQYIVQRGKVLLNNILAFQNNYGKLFL